MKAAARELYVQPDTEISQWMSVSSASDVVSVIIPTYNRAHYVTDALDSVFEQTYRPIEVILVDDGSTDNTEDVVRSWNRTHDDEQFALHYLRQSHRGAQVARNRGLVASTGAYIQYLDSDDVLLPEKIARHVRILNDRPDLDYVYARTQMVDDSLSPIPGRYYGESLETQDWARGVTRYLWHSSAPLLRREVVRETGPWLESLTGSQDWEYSARLKLLGYSAYFDNKTFSHFRVHDTGNVGVDSFDFDYARSAERAYDHICKIARQMEIMNSELAVRLTRLYLVQAAEFHKKRFSEDRERCIQKALQLPPHSSVARQLARFSVIVPSLLTPFSQAVAVRNQIKQFQQRFGL